MNYKERFDLYSEHFSLTARQYIGILKLAMGCPTMTSAEAMKAVTERDYKAAVVALSSTADFTPEELEELKKELEK